MKSLPENISGGRPAPSSRVARIGQRVTGKKPSVLFVDDERRILTALRALFRAEYQVFLANGGAEALDIVRGQRIHAIVSDQRMPGMLGHELLREVKQISPSTMRLLLTGYSDLGAIMRSINEGEVFRFIHKPWNVTEIRSIIATAVEIAVNSSESVAEPEFETKPAKQTRPAKKKTEIPAGAAAVMVLDDGLQTHARVSAMFENQRRVLAAPTVDRALGILGAEDVAVLITDTSIGGRDATDFIKLLKQQHPMIMTIVLTESIDSESAIELINQAQIFRYLRKPIGDNVLRLSVMHGLRFYQTNSTRPELIKRHQVESFRRARNPSLAARMAKRLRSLGKRLRRP